MKAIVLVGGQGTRMRPLTFAIPKPLLAVCEKPILQLIIEQLTQAGCEEVTLATGYLSELIETFCGDGTRFGTRIRYVKETKPLGTAGPVALLRERLARDEFFILMNGDIITKLDYMALFNFARRRDYELTVGYVEHLQQSPFGVLTIDGQGEIVGVIEKPTTRQCISGGIYVLKGSVLELIPDDQFFTVPELIGRLRASGRPVGAYHIKEFWQGVEIPKHIERVRLVLNGERNAVLRGQPKRGHQPDLLTSTGDKQRIKA